MKNLNQLFKIPCLSYEIINKYVFENEQINKLIEEIEEFQIETDNTKKCCELFDVIQTSFSLLELFSRDEVDQAYRLNIEKHENRKLFDSKYSNNDKKHKQFEIKGKYEVFKLLKI